MYVFFSLLVFLAIALTACAGPAAMTEAPPTELPAEATQPPATEAPQATAEPTERVREEGKLVLATTTSTQDSGLLDYLLPDFEEQFGVKVDVIAVGTGQAIALGEDGNADVLLVHARAKEDEFMNAGHGTRRGDVMYNDFVILGPEADPAGIKGTTSAAEAFKKIAETQSPFISRGDESGTHTKEIGIWKALDVTPGPALQDPRTVVALIVATQHGLRLLPISAPLAGLSGREHPPPGVPFSHRIVRLTL